MSYYDLSDNNREDLTFLNNNFGHPDDILESGYPYISFLCIKDHFWYSSKMVHVEMIDEFKIYKHFGFDEFSFYDQIHKNTSIILDNSISGRTARLLNRPYEGYGDEEKDYDNKLFSFKGVPISTITSFWYKSTDAFNELFKICINYLVGKQLIKPHDLLIIGTTPIRLRQAVPSFAAPIDISDKDIEKSKLNFQIHTMKGQQKKDNLLSMGAKPKLSAWNKVLGPGVKHWSIQGESNLNFKKWLNT